jgi:hypothetical protein
VRRTEHDVIRVIWILHTSSFMSNIHNYLLIRIFSTYENDLSPSIRVDFLRYDIYVENSVEKFQFTFISAQDPTFRGGVAKPAIIFLMFRFTLLALFLALATGATPDNVSSRLMIHVSWPIIDGTIHPSELCVEAGTN